MNGDRQDAIQQVERALLGSLLFDGSLWPQTGHVSVGDFSLDSHQRIYGCMAAMHEDGRGVDITTVGMELAEKNKLEAIGGAAYLGSLLQHAIPENFKEYVRRVIHESRERRFNHLCERLIDVTDESQRLETAAQIQELLKGKSPSLDGYSLFHTYDDFVNAPELEFAIDGFLQEGSATFIAALPGHCKTLSMLAMTRSLLSAEPLFGYFNVPQPSKRVLYLVPESTLAAFWKRIKLMRLEDYVRSRQLLVRTLSVKDGKRRLELDDPRLLHMAEGSDIFIDTVSRFMSGGEDIEDARVLADYLFGLLAAGARTITAAHHSPKAFESAKYMCLENVVRGSGDLGAAISTAWGMRQIDAVKNRVYIQNVKPRDFDPCGPFILEGRPHIDLTGCFKMIEEPGSVRDMDKYLEGKGGRPAKSDPQKIAQAVQLRAKGESIRHIARVVGVSKSLVDKWLFEYDSVSKN